MNRRDFLKSQLFLPTLSLMPQLIPCVSFSKDMEPQFFIQFYLDGGWDTTLSTEAWNFQTMPNSEKIFIEYSENDLLPFGNAFVGPTLAPLKTFFDRMTIFNGVMMSPVEVGHPSPTTFALSGSSDGTRANFVTHFYDMFYEGSESSFLTNSFISTGSKFYRSADFGSVLNLFSYTNDASVGSSVISEGFVSKAQKKLSKVLNVIKILENQYKDHLSKIVSTEHKILVKGFLSGYYPIAFLKSSGFLDTHANHINIHKLELIKNFEFIAGYLKSLSLIPFENSGKSLLDLTHVVITSEFTRTPRLNLGKGKDHNPFSNSMIIISPNFKSEQIFGSSRLLDSQFSPIGVPILVGSPLHKDTLRPHFHEADSFMMTPTTIYASIMDALGKNDQAPLLFKDSQKLKFAYK